MMKCSSSNSSHPITFLFAFAITLPFSAEISQAAIETIDSEELRNRAKLDEQERERRRQLPNVNLQGQFPEIEAIQLPISETPCFTIQNFVLEVPEQLSEAAHRYGASSLPQDRFHFAQVYLERYAGRCIGIEGINLIVRGLTAKILERGYSTTRLGIPEQDLASGVLRLTLIPGMIHELRFADKDARGTWKNAFPTTAGKILNLRDLEQGLEQMKRVPSQEVDIQIVPAENAGESDVIISVNRSKPWKASFTLNDSGAKGTGKTQAALQLAWDNLLDANDTLSMGISTDADRNNSMRGTQGNNISYSIPAGYWTATISANEFNYHQRIIGSVQSFVSSGQYQNMETKINYLFHRDQFSKSSMQLRTEKRWSHAYIDDTEITVQKRISTLAEVALLHKHNIGLAQLDSELAYRWGVPWFGAQYDAANLSNSIPVSRYALEVLDATLTIPFNLASRTLNYSATLRAQNTNTAINASEWFSIGNRWTVRGFDGETVLAAERGFFLRNELAMLIEGAMQTPYIGLDFGKVFGDSASGLIGNKLMGMVFGVRGNLSKQASYDVFIGGALYKPKNFRTDEPAAGFTLMYQM